jgi:hypothetical protein
MITFMIDFCINILSNFYSKSTPSISYPSILDYNKNSLTPTTENKGMSTP